MAKYSMEFEGLDEFLQALEDVDINSEQRIRKHLNKQGREFIDTAKENTPEKSGKLKNSYVSMRIEKNGKDYDKPIRNKAPHHHLVNNGHRQVDWRTMKQIGFVQGLHYIEKTVAEKEDDFASETEDWLDELYQELIG